MLFLSTFWWIFRCTLQIFCNSNINLSILGLLAYSHSGSNIYNNEILLSFNNILYILCYKNGNLCKGSLLYMYTKTNRLFVSYSLHFLGKHAINLWIVCFFTIIIIRIFFWRRGEYSVVFYCYILSHFVVLFVNVTWWLTCFTRGDFILCSQRFHSVYGDPLCWE